MSRRRWCEWRTIEVPELGRHLRELIDGGECLSLSHSLQPVSAQLNATYGFMRRRSQVEDQQSVL